MAARHCLLRLPLIHPSCLRVRARRWKSILAAQARNGRCPRAISRTNGAQCSPRLRRVPRTLWPEHERRARAYIDEIRRQLASHGAWMARRLESVDRSSRPTEPIFVEVTTAVPPFGASTIGEPPFTDPHTPLTTVSSDDPGYSKDTGLEMIFHEASHLLDDNVQIALETSAQRQARKLPDQVWHFLLFDTAGHLVRERLGPSYVPYAERPANTVFFGRSAWPHRAPCRCIASGTSARAPEAGRLPGRGHRTRVPCWARSRARTRGPSIARHPRCA